MSYEAIKLELRDNVALVTLNRPDALNSIDDRMATELAAVVSGIADGEIAARALLITGAGRGFSAGADLATTVNPDNPEMAKDVGIVLERHYNPLIKAMRDLPVPIVAAVNGACAGAGMSLALAADVILAARSAFFLQAFVNISLVPDAGSSYFLPRLIGRAKAARMMLLGEKISAEDAERWGMLSAVHDDDKLMDEALAVATRLAAGPTGAIALIRKMLAESEENSLAEQLDLERDYQRRAGRLEDFEEGVRAFLAKRKAEFKGR